MNIAVVGTGYVGLVAGACFAESGNDCICVDIDEKKIKGLREGIIPIYEPGLEDLVLRNTKEQRLKFTTSLDEAVKIADVIFIAVGTPQDEDGSADLTHVLTVARGIGKAMNGYKIIVDKSTVPVGTAAKVRKEISANTQYEFDVVSNPEFLKEGAALDDFMKPDRVVIGADTSKAAQIMQDLYAPFVRTNNPIIVMDVPSAEMTKYAANTMLATRISLMNEFAGLCEKAGADIDAVRRGIGTDARIGMSFLFPGTGYGGSCFPKDVQALIRTGEDAGVSMFISKAVEQVNELQKSTLVRKIFTRFGENLKGFSFGVWGLAFKPNTDDTREAPSLVVVESLLQAGATVKVFDPVATDSFKARVGENSALIYCNSNYEALNGVDGLVICTEWNEFRRPNFVKMKELMKQPIIFDGRNLYDLVSMAKASFEYHSVGRPSVKL